jgi:hypothetical protein
MGFRINDAIFRKCNNKINEVLTILILQNNSNWNIKDTNVLGMRTNFIMMINNKKISVACGIDTDGEIETILFTENDKIDNDSNMFHDDTNALIKYLNTF